MGKMKDFLLFCRIGDERGGILLNQQAGQVIEVSLKWLDVLSLFTGVASLVLAIIAIWLSFKFYQMSVASSNKMNESSNNINNNVEKLEKMFDTMYADTFGMVKETVSHMRLQVDKHNGAEDKQEEIEREINAKISEHINTLTIDNIKKDELENMVRSLLKETKEIELEINKNSLNHKVISVLSKHGEQSIKALEKRIFGDIHSEEQFKMLFDELYDLANRGVINNTFDNYNGELGISTNKIIKLKSSN